jgi:hypothetical protein
MVGAEPTHSLSEALGAATMTPTRVAPVRGGVGARGDDEARGGDGKARP